MKKIQSIAQVAFAIFLATKALAAGPKVVVENPDLTKGEPIPSGANHDWTLGATGARGWMFSDKLTTTDARQISITQVVQGSPATGVLQVGDVILGVGGKPFTHDPRTEFGKALTHAESAAGAGNLSLTRWRNGKTDEVVLKLAVLGDYSPTAPFDCPKSKRILMLGCEALAKRMQEPGYDKTQNPITRSWNALGLLASGEKKYLPLLEKEARWATGVSADSMQAWYYAPVISFLAEYQLATRDSSVAEGLRRLALESAKGQSMVGSWGHKFARPDGRLSGYGMMNSTGVPLTTALVLARAAGVKDPAINLAIERSTRLVRFFAGKGAVPYGDHAPWIENHEDNGKNGMATVLFDLLDEKANAEYFSRMCLASHGPERDCGHTGNFWNMLWAMPGVAASGRHATGAWMQEFGSWYFDFARTWDGRFPHQGPPQLKNDSTGGWDATGAYLIAYARPLKKIYLTGKRESKITQLSAEDAKQVIIAGRGWSNKDRYSAYGSLSNEMLLERARHWSPTVRERAAIEFGRRRAAVMVPDLIRLLESDDLHARVGACQALAQLQGVGANAVPALRSTLKDQDLWLRIKAAEALVAIGQPAIVALPELLEMMAQVDPKSDPRGMQQRFLASAVFHPRKGMMLHSLDSVDRKLLLNVIRAVLKNEDGAARGTVAPIFSKLSYTEIEPLLPAIHEAVVEPAPSGEMFSDGIRLEGLRVMVDHHIQEGIQICVDYIRTQNPWGSEKRIVRLTELLRGYGAHAKVTIPQLKSFADEIAKGENDYPVHLSRQKAEHLYETIRLIEASNEEPKLTRLQ